MRRSSKTAPKQKVEMRRKMETSCIFVVPTEVYKPWSLGYLDNF